MLHNSRIHCFVFNISFTLFQLVIEASEHLQANGILYCTDFMQVQICRDDASSQHNSGGYFNVAEVFAQDTSATLHFLHFRPLMFLNVLPGLLSSIFSAADPPTSY